MKKIGARCALYISSGLALLPVVAGAALVPCGGAGDPCTWCDLMQLFKNVIDFMLYLAIPLAVIMIIVGGILIMTAGGSTERASKGKSIITAAVGGLVIALLSWLIIDIIIKIIGQGWRNLKIGPWNDLNC